MFHGTDYDTLLEVAQNLHGALTDAKKFAVNVQAALTANRDIPSAYAIGKVEQALHNASNQLALLQALYYARKPHNLPARNIYRRGNSYVIATPYLPRKNNTLHESYITCEALIDGLLRAHPLDLGTATHISITMIQVYPTGTPDHYMTDPDNVSTKRMVDNIAVALGIDDGGTTIRLTVINCISDRLPAGMYTIVEPRDYEAETLYYTQKLEDIINESETN